MNEDLVSGANILNISDIVAFDSSSGYLFASTSAADNSYSFRRTRDDLPYFQMDHQELLGSMGLPCSF